MACERSHISDSSAWLIGVVYTLSVPVAEVAAGFGQASARSLRHLQPDPEVSAFHNICAIVSLQCMTLGLLVFFAGRLAHPTPEGIKGTARSGRDRLENLALIVRILGVVIAAEGALLGVAVTLLSWLAVLPPEVGLPLVFGSMGRALVKETELALVLGVGILATSVILLVSAWTKRR